MATIIMKSELPAKLQTADLIDAMIAGANANASRVAPCLIAPTTDWAATTAYTVGQKVKLTGGEALKVTVAGTSAATAPTAPEFGETVEDGTVTWERIAPTPDHLAEAKLILFGAIKRWVEAGSGAVQAQTAGPFGLTVDTRQKSGGYNLWPSDIERLQEICSATSATGAFSITPTGATSAHMPWCDLMLGGATCSCGADLTNYEYPLYEGGVLSGDEY